MTAFVAYDPMGESIENRMDVSDLQQHTRQPASTVWRDKMIWLLNDDVLHVDGPSIARDVHSIRLFGLERFRLLANAAFKVFVKEVLLVHAVSQNAG
jgi:hypothetical protein